MPEERINVEFPATPKRSGSGAAAASRVASDGGMLLQQSPLGMRPHSGSSASSTPSETMCSRFSLVGCHLPRPGNRERWGRGRCGSGLAAGNRPAGSSGAAC